MSLCPTERRIAAVCTYIVVSSFKINQVSHGIHSLIVIDCDIEVKDWSKVTLIDCVKGFSDFAASLLSFCRLLFLFRRLRHRTKKSMPHRVILVGMAFFCLFTTACQKLDLRRPSSHFLLGRELIRVTRHVTSLHLTGHTLHSAATGVVRSRPSCNPFSLPHFRHMFPYRLMPQYVADQLISVRAARYTY